MLFALTACLYFLSSLPTRSLAWALLYVCENTVLVTSQGYNWITAQFGSAGHAIFPHTAVISYHNLSSHLCFWVAESMTPTQTSDVHQWGPITETHESTHAHVDNDDYKTCVDHIPTAPCCFHYLITTIRAFLCYYSLTVYNDLWYLYYMQA